MPNDPSEEPHAQRIRSVVSEYVCPWLMYIFGRISKHHQNVRGSRRAFMLFLQYNMSRVAGEGYPQVSA